MNRVAPHRAARRQPGVPSARGLGAAMPAPRKVTIAHARQGLMTRHLISSGSRFEAEIGYSRAVVDGDWIFVAGTTGFDYAAMTIADDVVEQAAQTLRNVESALAQAGASLADVVRVRYLLPDAADFPRCWPVLREAFGETRPAATMMAVGLADPRMKIEIEVTARRRAAGPGADSG